MTAALTFDDGPSVWTQKILDILREHGARATFFVIGKNGEQRPDLVRRIAAEGHEVGNHTWSHPSLARDCDDETVRAELERTNEFIGQTLGEPPRIYRAPHFDVDARVDAVAAQLGLRHVGADVHPPDWHESWSAKLTLTVVLNQTRDGSILCLHDGMPPYRADSGATRDATVAAVASFVPDLLARGVRFTTASELLEAQQA